MKAITYLLHLEEPLLATQVNNEEPNSAVSFPFIPGSLIRGALIRHFPSDRKQDLPADDKGQRLFLDGSVRYLNAYLYDRYQQHRLLPRPRSWFVEKDIAADEDATIFDFAVAHPDDDIYKPKLAPGEFTTLIAGKPLLASPLYQVTVHNASSEPGRKAEGISQVYRYQALAPGQSFAGAILAEDNVDLSDLEDWLKEGVFFLGGSATGGYGRVEISDVTMVNVWHEYEPETAIPGRHIVTLLSDAIIRTFDGQISAAFAQALGLPAAAVQAFQDVYVVGGFNKKWGLPLPQAWAIRAGSVFCIQEAAISRDILADLVASGIGERREEGFGRLALNWHTQPQRQRTATRQPAAAAPAELSFASREMAQQMANRRLRAHLEERLQAALDVRTLRFSGLPSASQLARVRLAARHALARQELARIYDHMNSLTGARKDWSDARLNGRSLFDWIQRQSQLHEQHFRDQFGLAGRLPVLAGVEGTVTKELEVEYRARLIDGVMKLAVEQKKIEQGGSK